VTWPARPFGVLVIGLLLAACLWILRPFLGPTIWAVMVVVATWPLMLRVQATWGPPRPGRGGDDAAAAAAVRGAADAWPSSPSWATPTASSNGPSWPPYRLPETPPRWLADAAPGGQHGRTCGRRRRAWAARSAAQAEPYAGNLTRWFVAEVGSIGFCCCSS
jgi:hypothetical protein